MRLVVSGAVDVDAEELDLLTAQLRRRLLELDVDGVRLAGSDRPVPEGAKPGELLTVGALAVTLAPTVIRPALRLVETWMSSRPVRTVKVEWDGRTLELGAATPEQQERLLTAFLEGSRAESDASPATAEEPSARD
ncbi:hypothetical protein [Streptomyces sp. NPDC055134]